MNLSTTIVDRTNKVKDVEKALDNLTSQLQTYFEKFTAKQATSIS